VKTWLQSLLHENGLNFPIKVNIYPEKGVSQKRKVFSVYAGLLMQDSLEGELWVQVQYTL